MIFKQGRDNLSATIYVPFDCANDCKFCTSKQEYKRYKMDVENIKIRLREISNSSIQEVVFTGGEPMNNVDVLKELISIVRNKDVFINTSLISNSQFVKFIMMVNETSCIKGVNISRHKDSYGADCTVLSNIMEDSYIKLISKPVKINVVLDKETSIDTAFLKRVIKRWHNLNKSNLKVCFRADFTTRNTGNIHDLSDPMIQKLSEISTYVNRTFCNVCDTTNFEYNDISDNCGITISYHRGTMNTSIRIGNVIEINDIIVRPDGSIDYDWDGKNDNIDKMKSAFGLEVNQPRIVIHGKPIDIPSYFTCGNNSSSKRCGVSEEARSTTLYTCGGGGRC